MATQDEQTVFSNLTRRAQSALVHWGLGEQQPELLKLRENAVFRIRLANGEPAALRLHRAGYHSEAALRSELQWMAHLKQSGLQVPAPIPTLDGDDIVALEADGDFELQHADIVSWMNGVPLGETGAPLDLSSERLVSTFAVLGAAMAQMHNITDRWAPPAGFSRPNWDIDGLVGESPLWGRFWDCPGLTPEQASMLSALRDRLLVELRTIAPGDLDYGLIHADLVRENVMLDGDGIAIIDFDDSGYGFRMFDIATALIKNMREPEFPAIRNALIEGYRSCRELTEQTLARLPLFLLLRSLTYIGWAGSRLDEPGTPARMARFIAQAQALAQDWDESRRA